MKHIGDDVTKTTEGPIPHHPHPTGDFVMPVMLDTTGGRLDKRLPPKRTDTGALVFALPGGGEYVVFS